MKLEAKIKVRYKYNPDQPRIPAGQSGGGRWTSGGWTDRWGNTYTRDDLLSMENTDDLISTLMSLTDNGAIDFDTALAIIDERKKLKPSEQEPKPPSEKPKWEPKNVEPMSKAEEILSDVPDIDLSNPLERSDRWAARFTKDFPADKERGYSYADWAVSPYDNINEAKIDWPSTEIVYDKEMGGYVPVLSGLSSFTDWQALNAFQQAKNWANGKGWESVSDVYPYLVVYRARTVGFGPDGEALTYSVGKEEYVFSTKD